MRKNMLVLIIGIIFIMSCKKENTAITVKDVDGNVYETVKIGDQIWMKQNLKTTRYNDGSAINTDLNDAAWQATTSGAYAIYNNDVANNNTYGKLYNWYAVNTGKLAPKGWHVPTETEFLTLVTFLGGFTLAGDKMKSTTLWTPFSGVVNTNSSGFTGLPAGVRSGSGGYSGLGNASIFWSATAYNALEAFDRQLSYKYSALPQYNDSKSGGYSVRCIKD